MERHSSFLGNPYSFIRVTLVNHLNSSIINHIFFDLDHTLWDFEANSIETLGELYAEFKLYSIADADAQYFIDRYVYHNEKLWTLYRENKVSKGRLRKARFELALKDVNVEDKALAKRLGEAYLAQCPMKTKLMDGSIEILESLAGIYRLHIMSNGFHKTQLIKLKESKLDVYFEEVITSERASAKKPNPKMYHFATELTKAPKEGTIMIGDNLDVDVKGALDFGWEAIHYNPKGIGHSYPQVRHLNELESLLIKRG